ncbi:MAG: ATP-binding cassette domain-containing protein [Clostridium sp.]|uniref:ABC transporter ATP-binding protein n=1 Tax=Clostridium sp. TaxID=1506 RepID=UPI002FC78DCA
MKAIEINSLTKEYGSKRGVNNISFEVLEGDIVGFIGPNGAGKSTTIKALLNFIFPTSGECEIFSLDCVKDSKKIKEFTGYVPSEVRFYDDMKVKDIIKYGESFYENVDKDRISNLCQKLDIEENKKMGELSLGNKKKVAIVQALINSPKLIILDEPTNGLDPLIQKKLFEILLEENKKGTTIFLSSHNLTEVQNYCHKAVIIKEGEIVDIQDINSLKEKKKKRIVIKGENIKKQDIENINGEILSEESGKFTFSYKGNINKLITNLSKFEIEDIEISEEDLMDTFLNYYKEGEK